MKSLSSDGYLFFEMNTSLFGVDSSYISQVVSADRIFSLPFMPKWVVGFYAVDTAVFPIVDLCVFAEITDAPMLRDNYKLLLLSYNRMNIALLADSFLSIQVVASERVRDSLIPEPYTGSPEGSDLLRRGAFDNRRFFLFDPLTRRRRSMRIPPGPMTPSMSSYYILFSIGAFSYGLSVDDVTSITDIADDPSAPERDGGDLTPLPTSHFPSLSSRRPSRRLVMKFLGALYSLDVDSIFNPPIWNLDVIPFPEFLNDYIHPNLYRGICMTKDRRAVSILDLSQIVL